jgi:hypothetical protein
MHTFHGRLDELGVGLHLNQAIGVDRDMNIVECVYCADHSYSGTQGRRRCADDASLACFLPSVQGSPARYLDQCHPSPGAAGRHRPLYGGEASRGPRDSPNLEDESKSTMKTPQLV